LQPNKREEFTQNKASKSPQVVKAAHYGTVKYRDYISFEEILSQITPIVSNEPKTYGVIRHWTNYGQDFGFISYRIETNKH